MFQPPQNPPLVLPAGTYLMHVSGHALSSTTSPTIVQEATCNFTVDGSGAGTPIIFSLGADPWRSMFTDSRATTFNSQVTVGYQCLTRISGQDFQVQSAKLSAIQLASLN